MTSKRVEKWGTSEACPQGYRALRELSENVNSSSIGATVQKLCLPEVRLPFLESSRFAPTSNAASGTFYLVGGCLLALSRMYSQSLTLRGLFKEISGIVKGSLEWSLRRGPDRRNYLQIFAIVSLRACFEAYFLCTVSTSLFSQLI